MNSSTKLTQKQPHTHTHTDQLKVKAEAGLLKENQPTTLNIAAKYHHCVTIRGLSNKVLTKQTGG